MRFACVWGVLSTIAVPSALGAAMGPVLRQLGMRNEHMCMCHMPAGKCGCPQCARLEAERLRERRVDAVPTWKKGCEDDGSATLFASLPATIPPRSALVPLPTSELVFDVRSDRSPPCLDRGPPTPPPRRATV
jgi:hypothetical protein